MAKKKAVKKGLNKAVKKILKKTKKKVAKTTAKKAMKASFTRKATQKTSGVKKVAKKVTKKTPKKNKTSLKSSVAPKIDANDKGVVSLSSGEKFDLSNYLGKKVVLYFYPKDDTPGCTIQGNQFNALLPEFEKAGAVVLGVSRDSLASHKKFITKFDFKFELVSDPSEQLCQRFDVIKDKNMYGKMVKGIERSTFIFNQKGELVKEWRKVVADGNAAEALAFVQSMN